MWQADASETTSLRFRNLTTCLYSSLESQAFGAERLARVTSVGMSSPRQHTVYWHPMSGSRWLFWIQVNLDPGECNLRTGNEHIYMTDKVCPEVQQEKALYSEGAGVPTRYHYLRRWDSSRLAVYDQELRLA